MNLTENELNPYLGGRLKIKKNNKDYILYGGIETLCINENTNTLKIGFIWAIEFQSKYDGFEESKFVHVPTIKEYSVNLENCNVPSWEKKEYRVLHLYSSDTRDIITFHLANYNGGNHNFNPLDIGGCPDSLKQELEKMKVDFLSKVDLSKIPIIDFGIEKISTEEMCRFMRIDLWWKEKAWSFIRIQKNPDDNHSLIFYDFLHKIAEQYSLSGRDIEEFVNCRGGGKGGGFLLRTKENKIEIRGSSTYFRVEKNRQFTVSLLEEVLSCEVYEV